MGCGRPCCCECCCGFQGCVITIGILCLIVASLNLLYIALVFGVAAAFLHHDGAVIAIVTLALLIAIFAFIINILLIVGACQKKRCLVMIWFWGTIVLCILIVVATIVLIYLRDWNYFWTHLFWVGLMCYFLWVAWEFSRECN